MRIGKTGSKSTISQLSKTEVSGCAQTAVFHDILAAQLPPTQAKLTVMREPCDRASSVLRHLHEFAPPSDRVHAVRTLTGLAEYLQARWSKIFALNKLKCREGAEQLDKIIEQEQGNTQFVRVNEDLRRLIVNIRRAEG